MILIPKQRNGQRRTVLGSIRLFNFRTNNDNEMVRQKNKTMGMLWTHLAIDDVQIIS